MDSSATLSRYPFSVPIAVILNFYYFPQISFPPSTILASSVYLLITEKKEIIGWSFLKACHSLYPELTSVFPAFLPPPRYSCLSLCLRLTPPLCFGRCLLFCLASCGPPSIHHPPFSRVSHLFSPSCFLCH